MTPYGRRNKGLSRRPQSIFDMDGVFDNFFSDSYVPSWFMGDNQMKVDIKENENEYIVEADMPGVKKEQINIELHNDRLTIAVETNEEVNEEKENYIRRERRSGSFSRSFYVENVKDDEIKARFENGVLSVLLPKEKSGISKRNRIDIE